MTSMPGLEFVAEGGLSVAYAPSEVRHRMHVKVRADKDADSLRPAVVQALIGIVRACGAGGAEYPPEAGEADIIAHESDGTGVEEWVLEVAGVAGSFLRTVVERLASADANESVRSLSIHGGPPGARPRISEHELRDWLRDTETFPEAWPKLGFLLGRVALSKGIAIRAITNSWVSAGALLRFREVLDLWHQAVFCYPHISASCWGIGDSVPSVLCGNQALLGRYSTFYYSSAAERVLLNMLHRYSNTVLPIRSVTIAGL